MRLFKEFSFYTSLGLFLGLILAGRPVQAELTRQRMIQETGFPQGTTVNTGIGAANFYYVDTYGAKTETLVKMQLPPSGTGFAWGGYESSANVPPPGSAPYRSKSSVQFAATQDGAYGSFVMFGWAAGQYYYTIFSSSGSKTPDQYVDLSTPSAQIGWNNWAGTAISNVIKIRWLVRTNNNAQWYVSSPCTVSPVPTTSTPLRFPVNGTNGMTWYAMDAAVNTNLNLLAGSDEAALSYAATASTPDLSKVDGGGFLIDTGVDPGAGTSFKPSRLTFDSNLPTLAVASTPTYPNNYAAPAPLVLGMGTGSGKITLSNGNSAGGGLTIKSATIASSDGRITGTPSAGLPQTLTTDSVDVNINFAQVGTQSSTATLAITYTYPGAAGDEKLEVPIVGRGLVTGTILESFANPVTYNTAGSFMARARTPFPNETPEIMRGPNAGAGNTGFIWGAYTNATVDATPRDQVGIQVESANLNSGRLLFMANTTEDATKSGCYKGSYAYGLFDTMGGQSGVTPTLTIDRQVNLHKFRWFPSLVPSGGKIRWLIRDDTGKWFLSKDVVSLTSAMVNTWNESDIESFSGWLRVNAAAEDNMNGIAARKATPGPQVAISDPATLTAETPHTIVQSPNNILMVTGAGVYIEQGNTTADNVSIDFNDLNLISQPVNGDKLNITHTPVTEAIPVPNRRLALGGLTLSVTGVESALDGVDVTVTPGTAGLRGVILMSDPNGNGRPDDGEELTNCTLDADGKTAHVTFRSTQLITGGTPQKMSLVAVFDDTASSKTYSFALPAANWKQNVENGGNDTLVANIAPSVKVAPLAFPALDTLLSRTLFIETWNQTTEAKFADAGYLVGTDNLWRVVQGNAGTFFVTAFKSVTGGMALQNETRDMTDEPWYQNSIAYNGELPALLDFDTSNTAVVKLGFDLTFTSVTMSNDTARLSSRTIGDGANVTVRLGSFDDNQGYSFTVYPLLDASRYLFGIAATGGVSQFAPANIKAYANAPYTGAFKFTVWLAPYGAAATIAKVNMTETGSGKTLAWMTVLDGKLPNLNKIRLAYGAFPNALVDNVVLTTYNYWINPVRRWSLFE